MLILISKVFVLHCLPKHTIYYHYFIIKSSIEKLNSVFWSPTKSDLYVCSMHCYGCIIKQNIVFYDNIAFAV